jgi:release factor glutamine methyltransferase
MMTTAKPRAPGPAAVAPPARSVGEALARAAAVLAAADSPRLTAEVLLAHVLGTPRPQLLARPEELLSAAAEAQYAHLAERAAAAEPLAYLTGQREFYGLAFLVDARVLVPRPETELLVDLVLSSLPAHPPTRVLDVGTGSGCLAVTLAVKLPRAQVIAVDVSRDALAVARANAKRHRVTEQITFVLGDLLSSFILHPSPFDLLLANLPYIASDELPTLAVSRHEPASALDGGPDGLTLIRRLLADAPRVMTPAGRVLLEIGATQGRAAAALAQAAFPSARVTVHQDLAGLDRVIEIEL